MGLSYMPLPPPSISRLVAGALLLVCVAAGYLFAEWWFGGRDTTQLAKICGRVEYINGLQQRFGADIAEEVREQLSAAVEECRSALRDRAECASSIPPKAARGSSINLSARASTLLPETRGATSGDVVAPGGAPTSSCLIS
jgi:hypothetical protein